MQITGLDLGRIGLWTFALDRCPAGEARQAAAEFEALGYGAIWIPEAVGREPFANSMLLLSGTERIKVATGIASIHARSAMTMAAGHKTVTEAYPDRFLLGLGVSHAPAVAMFHKGTYEKPLATMSAYLDAMDSAPWFAATPSTPPRRVLAALGPKMLRLAAEKASGAHPYFVPPEHTAVARGALGPDPFLAPEQKVLLESDPATARKVARQYMATYLGLPNYTNNLLRLGYTADDIAGGGSDRLVDAIVAWGTVEQIRARVHAHLDAGADHVCVQVLHPDQRALPSAEIRELGPALLALPS